MSCLRSPKLIGHGNPEFDIGHSGSRGVIFPLNDDDFKTAFPPFRSIFKILKY